MKFPRPTQPWKSGRFPVSGRGDFSKNSGILQLTKMGPFWGEPCTVQYASGWLVGLVRKVLIHLWPSRSTELMVNDECGVRKQPFAVVRRPLDKRKLYHQNLGMILREQT